MPPLIAPTSCGTEIVAVCDGAEALSGIGGGIIAPAMGSGRRWRLLNRGRRTDYRVGIPTAVMRFRFENAACLRRLSWALSLLWLFTPMSVSTIGSIGRIETALPKTSAATAAAGVSFAESLGKALETVEEKNQEANVAVTGMLDKSVDVHDAMIALHESEESLEITVAIRNKFVKAYQEIMAMGI